MILPRFLPAVLGALFIVAALALATGKTNQDAAQRPQAALVFETALHASPTPPPTVTTTPLPTLTAAPTVTPIDGWTRFDAGDVQLWLPRTFAGRIVRGAGGSISYDDGVTALYAVDTASGTTAAPTAVWVMRIQDTAQSDAVAMAVIDNHFNYYVEEPHTVSLGRYQAVRSVVDGPSVANVRVTRLVYWIKHGDVNWLIVFIAPVSGFDGQLPIFQASIQSFSILQ